MQHWQGGSTHGSLWPPSFQCFWQARSQYHARLHRSHFIRCPGGSGLPQRTHAQNFREAARGSPPRVAAPPAPSPRRRRGRDTQGGGRRDAPPPRIDRVHLLGGGHAAVLVGCGGSGQSHAMRGPNKARFDTRQIDIGTAISGYRNTDSNAGPSTIWNILDSGRQKIRQTAMWKGLDSELPFQP